MKKILVSTTFIFLTFTPFIFGNNYWNQNFNEQKSNTEDDISDKFLQVQNSEVFEDAILLINDNSALTNYQEFPEIDLDDLAEIKFVSILNQRPISEATKILSRPFNFQDFTVLELKTNIENGEIIFFDQTGKPAYQQKFNGNEFELKRNDLTSGIYFYKISENGNAINSGKIMVN